MRMNKSYTLLHFTILSTKKSREQKFNNKKSLKKVFKRYTKALHLFKLSPSDEVVNNILKHVDL